MYLHSLWTGILMFSVLLFVSGCATQQALGPTASSEQVQQTIPPDSPFAQIREGMGFREVRSVLGEPTDQETAATGKAFIPFYFGADRVTTRLYYKGLGQIYMSGEGVGIGGGGGRVIKIVYDPQESGFRK